MATDKKSYGQEWIEESASAKADQQLNLQSILFLQINRCNILQSVENDQYPQSVEALESCLFPYLDDQYKTEIGKVTKKIKEELEKSRGPKGITQYLRDQANWHKAKMKFRYLMGAAERAGLLPSRTLEIDLG